MKRLVIVGAGGFGREVLQWVQDVQKQDKRWESISFINDKLNSLDDYNLEYEITGTIADYVPVKGEEIICAIGDPEGRLKVCSYLLERGAIFTNIIHPTAVIGKQNVLGKGIIICPGSIITTNVRVEDFVIINCLTTIGHDVVIEKGCTISSHCDITGNSYLEKGVFLGSGARVLPNSRVEKNAKVGAGSVVLRRVKESTTVFGNPARVI